MVASSLEVSSEFIRFVLAWLAALIPTPGYFWKVDVGMTTCIRGSIDSLQETQNDEINALVVHSNESCG